MVYGFASFGVSLNYFYCCGSLKTVSLSDKKVQEAADHCPMKGDKGCCENKIVNHKISVDQNLQSTLFYEFTQLTSLLAPPPFYLAKAAILYTQLPEQIYKRPPPVLSQTNLVFLSVFRI